MKASEYRQAAEEARRSGIEERWGRRVENPEAKVVECKFCTLKREIAAPRDCSICPVHTEKYMCCGLYTKWDNASTSEPFKEKLVAVEMVEYLKGLDLDAWTDKLVKEGVLEEDRNMPKHKDGERFMGRVWIGSKQYLPKDGYLVVEKFPKSAHKPGEHFDDKWDYAGEKRKPRIGDTCIDLHGYLRTITEDFGINVNLDNGYREILIPRLKYKIGDKVWCTGFIYGFSEREFEPQEGEIKEISGEYNYLVKPINVSQTWYIEEDQLSPLPVKDINHDPEYLEALEASWEHHKDGANRTEENYQYFKMGFNYCACCKYFGYKCMVACPIMQLFPDCSKCFLTRGEKITSCAPEFYEANAALGTSNFPAFHEAELALLARIEAERDRVREIQKPKEKSESPKYIKGQPVVYRGMIMDYFEMGYNGHKVIDRKTDTLWSGIGNNNICPAVSADYEKKIGGIPTRVYEEEDGSIRVVMKDEWGYYVAVPQFNRVESITLACLRAQIPFIPMSISKGVFDPPKEE